MITLQFQSSLNSSLILEFDSLQSQIRTSKFLNDIFLSILGQSIQIILYIDMAISLDAFIEPFLILLATDLLSSPFKFASFGIIKDFVTIGIFCDGSGSQYDDISRERIIESIVR